MVSKQAKREYRRYLLAGLLVCMAGCILAVGSVLAAQSSYDRRGESPVSAVDPPILVGHVIWQQIPQNNWRSSLPITLTLKMGDTEVNYPLQFTDVSGYFTVSVDGLPSGTYQWRVQSPDGPSGGNASPGFLANSGTVVLSGEPRTTMENSQVFPSFPPIPGCTVAPGCIRGGDANNDNLVTISDYNLLKVFFNQTEPFVADFNNDGVTNISDYNLMKSNFGSSGAEWASVYAATVETPLETPTDTPVPINTDTPTPAPVLVGHVVWQTIPQNSYRSEIPISLTLKSDTFEVNYPRQLTDNSGYFTVSVDYLPLGTYNWRVQKPFVPPWGDSRPGFLANCGTVTLFGSPRTSMENSQIFPSAIGCTVAPGCMRGGDPNSDNIIAISDFNILKNSFNLAGIQLGDFDNNQITTVADFNILKGNFGQQGCPAP